MPQLFRRRFFLSYSEGKQWYILRAAQWSARKPSYGTDLELLRRNNCDSCPAQRVPSMQIGRAALSLGLVALQPCWPKRVSRSSADRGIQGSSCSQTEPLIYSPVTRGLSDPGNVKFKFPSAQLAGSLRRLDRSSPFIDTTRSSGSASLGEFTSSLSKRLVISNGGHHCPQRQHWCAACHATHPIPHVCHQYCCLSVRNAIRLGNGKVRHPAPINAAKFNENRFKQISTIFCGLASGKSSAPN